VGVEDRIEKPVESEDVKRVFGLRDRDGWEERVVEARGIGSGWRGLGKL